MEEKEFKFDAFISYRHNDLDKYVAENLHRLIETYKMPKPVVEKYHITDNNIRRVFRDQEELPLAANLEDPIIEALKESRFLIVICSPRLKESMWCKREIENFIKMHGRSNILCVLVEGEPKDSFPEELLHYEVKAKSGEERIETVECEPLAMDVRGNNKKEIYQKLKAEVIRIIAPMYHLDYDDIKRRHEERKLKNKIKIFRAIAIVSILFALYSGILFFNIYISSKKLKYDQAINLANSAQELLEKDDRQGALEKAYQSVTTYHNIKMPVTSEGIYELTESLGVYYLPDYYYAQSQLNTVGKVESIKTDSSQQYLLSYDNSGELVLWNLENETRIKTFSDTTQIVRENSYTFIGSKAFVYQNQNKEVVVFDLKGKEIVKIPLDFWASRINASENGKYIAISDNTKIVIYETNTYTEISLYEIPADMYMADNIYFDEKEENMLFSICKKSSEITNYMEVLTYHVSNNEIMNQTVIQADSVTKILFQDENAIVLANRKVKLNNDMVITHYNYQTGTVFYEKEYIGKYPLDMKMNFSAKDNHHTVLISSFEMSYLLDFYTGEEKGEFSIGAKEVDTYTLVNADMYLVFTSTGDVHAIAAEDNGLSDEDKDTVYIGVFNLQLSGYERFLYTNKGLITYTSNDNRIVIYGQFHNKNIKPISYQEKEFDTIEYADEEPIIQKYQFKKKNLIYHMFYSNDKKLLFVTYSDNTLEIYNNETKELLKSIVAKNSIQYLNKYIGKTQNDEYIIGGLTSGYILNKDFEIMAYVPNLYDYHNGKLILKSESQFYEVNLYSETELIQKAKKKLNLK